MINQAVLLCEGTEIESFNFQGGFISEPQQPGETLEDGKSLKDTIEKIVDLHEKRIISKVLSANNQNRTRTALSLDITRKTLARKIDKYNL